MSDAAAPTTGSVAQHQGQSRQPRGAEPHVTRRRRAPGGPDRPGSVPPLDGSQEALGMYLQQIGRVPLLTPEAEVDLAKRIVAGDTASRWLDTGPPRRLVERRYLQRITRDGQIARRELLEANLRLVVAVAKRYATREMPLGDLVQEGNVGLMRAVEKFDYQRGYKFSTYASWWIRQAITRALADHSRTIRLPVHTGESLLRLFRVRRQLAQELGQEPTTSEIARQMGITPRSAEQLLRFEQEPVSLESPVGEGESARLGDFVEDTAEVPLETVSGRLLAGHLRGILHTLEPRERQVITLRYGMTDGRVHTLDEIAAIVGVTRERVRHIERETMAKLRHPSRALLLKGYLD